MDLRAGRRYATCSASDTQNPHHPPIHETDETVRRQPADSQMINCRVRLEAKTRLPAFTRSKCAMRPSGQTAGTVPCLAPVKVRQQHRIEAF